MTTGRSESVLGRTIISSVVTGLLFLCLSDVHAQQSTFAGQGSNKRIVNTITRTQMKTLMSGEGYAVTTDDDGDLVWKIEGFRIHMFVAKDGESLQFHVSFGDGNATLRKVNEWNRTKRYSRTYLDDEGDPHLELDLDLAGGVTQARVVDFLRTCRVSFVAWCAEVVK